MVLAGRCVASGQGITEPRTGLNTIEITAPAAAGEITAHTFEVSVTVDDGALVPPITCFVQQTGGGESTRSFSTRFNVPPEASHWQLDVTVLVRTDDMRDARVHIHNSPFSLSPPARKKENVKVRDVPLVTVGGGSSISFSTSIIFNFLAEEIQAAIPYRQHLLQVKNELRDAEETALGLKASNAIRDEEEQALEEALELAQQELDNREAKRREAELKKAALQAQIRKAEDELSASKGMVALFESIMVAPPALTRRNDDPKQVGWMASPHFDLPSAIADASHELRITTMIRGALLHIHNDAEAEGEDDQSYVKLSRDLRGIVIDHSGRDSVIISVRDIALVEPGHETLSLLAGSGASAVNYRIRIDVPMHRETVVLSCADEQSFLDWYLGLSFLVHNGPSRQQLDSWIRNPEPVEADVIITPLEPVTKPQEAPAGNAFNQEAACRPLIDQTMAACDDSERYEHVMQASTVFNTLSCACLFRLSVCFECLRKGGAVERQRRKHQEIRDDAQSSLATENEIVENERQELLAKCSNLKTEAVLGALMFVMRGRYWVYFTVLRTRLVHLRFVQGKMHTQWEIASHTVFSAARTSTWRQLRLVLQRLQHVWPNQVDDQVLAQAKRAEQMKAATLKRLDKLSSFVNLIKQKAFHRLCCILYFGSTVRLLSEDENIGDSVVVEDAVSVRIGDKLQFIEVRSFKSNGAATITSIGADGIVHLSSGAEFDNPYSRYDKADGKQSNKARSGMFLEAFISQQKLQEEIPRLEARHVEVVKKLRELDEQIIADVNELQRKIKDSCPAPVTTETKQLIKGYKFETFNEGAAKKQMEQICSLGIISEEHLGMTVDVVHDSKSDSAAVSFNGSIYRVEWIGNASPLGAGIELKSVNQLVHQPIKLANGSSFSNPDKKPSAEDIKKLALQLNMTESHVKALYIEKASKLKAKKKGAVKKK